MEAELDIETVLSLAPKAEHRGLRRWRLGQPLRRLQPHRQRRHGEDRERELDERVRGVRRPVAPELGEHPLPGGGHRRAVGLRRQRGIRGQRAATSTGRSLRRRVPTRSRRPSTPRRAPSTSPTRRSNTVSVDSEGSSSNPIRLRHDGLGLDRVPDPMPSPSTRRRGRSSWRTRGARSRSSPPAPATSRRRAAAAHRPRSPRGATSAPRRRSPSSGPPSTSGTATARWRSTTQRRTHT